jgi:membrane-associated HD superfamily phosphohydrolase
VSTTVTAGLHRNRLIWFGLAVVTVVLVSWWWGFVTAAGAVPSIAAYVPPALPVLLIARGVVSGAALAPLVSGVALGLSLFGFTGRGAVFVAIGLASVLAELAVAGDAKRAHTSALLVAGFAVGVVVLSFLPA